jgi:(4-alkanoyl-5-oxo-2,5-dihydrofuran-3-yl)methyl phosphate reductase
MTYLITGATGEVGSRVTKQLVEMGERPRVLTRNREKALELFGRTVDSYQGDLSRPESCQEAFRGVNAAFLVSVGPEIPAQDWAAARTCRDLSVPKLVKLSSLDVEQGLAIGAWHEKGEEAIRKEEVPFVMVRPTGFMSNLLAWAPSIRRDRTVRSSTAEGRRPFIHPEDIASVCLKALTDDQYLGQSLPLTGPDSLSFRDATEMIATALGEPLKYEVISDQEAMDRYAVISASDEETEAHVALWRAIREGRLASTTHCVEKILRRKPMTLKDWISENVDIFRRNVRA